MRRLYKEKHVKDIASILTLAEPSGDAMRVLAERIDQSRSEFMERHLADTSSDLDSAGASSTSTSPRHSAIDTRNSGTVVEGVPQSSSQPECLPLEAEQTDSEGKNDMPALLELISTARKWTMTKSGAKSKEAQLYRPISAFVDYVAYWVDAELSTALASDTGLGRSRNEFRLIRPTTKTDYKPDDPDNGTKIDIGLCSTAVGNPTDAVGRAMFSRLMAVVEVKLSSGGSSVNDSFAQLYEYTRQVYAEQFDLRFAWGVTVCATEMRVCHFGPDLALSSCAMDEATPKGRQDFITLPVNWSLCEAAQLGRDPTISRVPGMNWWQIECPDDPNNGASEDGGCGSSYKPVKTYYFSRVICGADHLFGRYTRCLAATDIEPSEEAEAAGELKPRFVVKDAWPVADQDTTKHSCDEVLLLKRIKKALSVSSSEDLVYSQIAVGGRVNMTVDNALVEDNTDNLYKGVDIPSNIKVPRRAHRRIVTSPIGEPLHEVESVRELILVVGDIMHCHSAISTECSIFYRDISDNNILIVRREGEPTRGLLIDFDCALDLSKERTGMRGEMTGTFPSMSNEESNIISSQSHRPAFRKCNNTHTNDEHVG